MNPFVAQVQRGFVTGEFATEVERHWLRKSRILVLVDGRIDVQTDPPPEIGKEIVDSSGAFGIAIAIGVLKGFAGGFSSFEVTVATRDGDGSGLPGFDVTAFRFSDEALTRFDQVWMFGIWPDTTTDTLDPADDALIEDARRNPLSDNELSSLARWMDDGGGLFATGDHHLLGATMGHKVPRASLMRAWTIADGVPTKFSSTRHETTRPFTVEETLGAESINYPNEEDPLPQLIEWVPYSRSITMLAMRPHPLLCHPRLGPINVLPDHMHEGRCHDFSDPSWQADKRDRSFDFAGYTNQHFPTSGGVRPLPQVVAWGATLAAPPLNFAAGSQPARRYPLIAAYDGQEIGIGRVVTDSTWHHWFDLNLKGMMEHAKATGDRTVIDKIFRYYINVGIYLASPDWRTGLMLGWLKAEQFNYFGRQAISLADPAPALGRQALAHLKPALGPCGVSEVVGDLLSGDHIWPEMRAKAAGFRPTRHSVGFEEIEEAVVGEVVRAAYSDMDELRRQIASEGRIAKSPLLRNLYETAAQGAKLGLQSALRTHRRELEEATEQLDALEAAAGEAKAS